MTMSTLVTSIERNEMSFIFKKQIKYGFGKIDRMQ